MQESEQIPLYSGVPPAQVAVDIAELVNFKDEGMPLEDLQALIAKSLIPHLMRYDLPRFQSMFNTTPPIEALTGAQIMLEANQGVTNWQVSPGGAVLEELCCRELCKLFELEPSADATFMYSGTYANLQALYMALHRHAERKGFDFALKGMSGFADPRKLVILVSSDAHFSVRHAVRTLGLGEQSLVKLPLDQNYRIDLNSLEQKIREMEGSGEIICMVATAGTTITGAIDPIEGMVDVCAHIGAWMHIDGAYGYAYKLVPAWEQRYLGDDRADSIVWDPHKQLGAPIPNSVLFLRRGEEFARMALHSSYFNRPGDEEPNPGIKSPPSTRPMSALPLVTILRGQGIDQVVKNLKAPLNAIQALYTTLMDQPDVEVLHKPDTGILCFRMISDGTSPGDLDALQQRLYQQVMASGERSISITSLDGRRALRLVVVSPHTTFDDLYETIEMLRVLVHNQN